MNYAVLHARLYDNMKTQIGYIYNKNMYYTGRIL